MIFLAHGDDPVKIRNGILAKQKQLNVETKTELDISDTPAQKLLALCSTNSIFGEYPFILLNITGTGRKNVDEYLDVLKKVPKETLLFLVSFKELSQANPFIKNAQSLGIKIVKSDKIPDSDIFKFLDALASKNRKAVYSELSKLLEDESDEIYIITMIQYLLRNLALCLFESPLLAKINPYVKNKTQSQKKFFTPESIRSLYSLIYGIEKKVKTGQIDPGSGLTLAVEKVLNS